MSLQKNQGDDCGWKIWRNLENLWVSWASSNKEKKYRNTGALVEDDPLPRRRAALLFGPSIFTEIFRNSAVIRTDGKANSLREKTHCQRPKAGESTGGPPCFPTVLFTCLAMSSRNTFSWQKYRMPQKNQNKKGGQGRWHASNCV